MTPDEAKKVKAGDVIRVGALVARVEELKPAHGELFFATRFGDFNVSVCSTITLPEMTAELRARVVQALRDSWNYIGDDCYVDDNGRHDESVVFSRQEVADMAADAGRMQEHGGLTWEEEQAYFMLPDAEREAIILEAFPSARYGY